MTQNNILALKNKVYDAINIYQNNGRHALLKEYYEKIYSEYVEAGGKETIEYFEKTIDAYNIQGICGY